MRLSDSQPNLIAFYDVWTTASTEAHGESPRVHPTEREIATARISKLRMEIDAAQRSGISGFCFQWIPGIPNVDVVNFQLAAPASFGFCLVIRNDLNRTTHRDLIAIAGLTNDHRYLEADNGRLILVVNYTWEDEQAIRASASSTTYLIYGHASSALLEYRKFEAPLNHPAIQATAGPSKGYSPSPPSYAAVTKAAVSMSSSMVDYQTVLLGSVFPIANAEGKLGAPVSSPLLAQVWLRSAVDRSAESQQAPRLVFLYGWTSTGSVAFNNSNRETCHIHKEEPPGGQADLCLDLCRLSGLALKELPTDCPKSGRLIFVHQIGKVGSMSIATAIQAACPTDLVLHTHNLVDLDDLAKQYRKTYADLSYGAERIRYSLRARQILDEAPEHLNIRFITAVRHPVYRDISSFFENLRFLLPPTEDVIISDEVTTEELLSLYVDYTEHMTLSEWFQKELAAFFPVKQLLEAFKGGAGYGIASAGNRKSLLLKFEEYDTVLESALCEFLDIPAVRVPRINVTAERQYANLHRRLMGESLPPIIVDRLMGCPIAQSLYPPKF